MVAFDLTERFRLMRKSTTEMQIREDTRTVLQRIRARRQARGAVARSKEEIDAEIDAMRDADEHCAVNGS
jgi:hypothetical protein